MPLLFMVSAFAQEQQPLFRAGVTLVRIDAQVTNRHGQAILGLQASDFQIFDEGQPRKIEYFGREAELLDLLLLLDVSGSMHRSLEEMARTATSALAQLRQGDRVALMLFARNSALRQDFTEDFAAVQSGIREAVRERSLGSGTAMNAAILAAAGELRRQPVRGRRAALIVTDNVSLNYRVPDEEVIQGLYSADTVLNAILIGSQRRPDPVPPGATLNPDFTPSDVFGLAEKSGGEALEARRIGESFREMVERIRARYALHFAPPPEAATGAFRRLRVELTPEARRRESNLVVRARAGYFLRD